jgi:hypothetical protein
VDFWDLTKLLFRRWYIAGPLLLLTLGGTLLAATRIEPDYVATSYVQLVPPAITPKQNDGKTARPRNPWLDLGVSSLGKAALLTVQDQKVVEILKKSGFSDDFTLTLDSSLPIVTFEVIGDTEEQASSTAEELIKRFDASVATLQKEYGAVTDQSITTRQLDLGDNVVESTSKVKRALVAIGAVGLLLTVALTILVDAVVRRRRADRSGTGKDDEDAGPDDATGTNGREVAAAGPVVNGVKASSVVNGNRPADVKGNRHPDVVRQRARPVVAEERPGPGEETQVITIGEDATIALPRPNWRAPGDKGRRR